MLAVGVDADGVATSWRSSDGLGWEEAPLVGAGFDRARVRDVAATLAGWVMVGSTEARDVPSGGVMTPNGSVGAAWTSPDGVAWQPATVEGTGDQVELHRVHVGSDGLIAVGTLAGSMHADFWTSSDGSDWTPMPEGADGVTRPMPETSDGRWIIGTLRLSEDDGAPRGGIGWWLSTDGTAWSPLTSEGQVASSPRWDEGVAPDIIDIVGGTLVVLGQSGSEELVWLAPLVPPPA
jgi:hypothetical protein